MTLKVGPNDKTLRALLANSAQQTDPLTLQLRAIHASPDLKPDEASVLRSAAEVVIKLQLRREYPILERVLSSLMGRLKTGDAVQPLDTAQTKALVELMGTLSDAENAALNHLNDVGLIKPTDWQDVVKPHKAWSNRLEHGDVQKVKWGAALLANGLSPVAAAITLSMLIPGVGGALGAVVMATGMGLAVSPKVNAKIQFASSVENRAMGMNTLEGRETVSEPVLLTARLAEGAAFQGPNMAANLAQEVELMNLLLKARSDSNKGWGGYESAFLQSAGNYQAGVEALAKEHATTPMSDAAMRRELFDFRATLMAPEKMLPLVQLVAAINVPPNDDTRIILGHRQMAEAFALVSKQVAVGSPEAPASAQFILSALPVMDDEVQGSVTSFNKLLLNKVIAGAALTPDEQGQLKTASTDLMRIATDALSYHGLDASGAKKRGSEIVEAYLRNVLPAFGQESGDVKVRDVSVTTDRDGSFVVRGGFKSGWFAQEGGFHLKVGRDATADMSEVKIDIGPKRASAIAQAAVTQAATLLQTNGRDVQVTNVSGGNGGNDYSVDVTVAGKALKVAVTSMGLVDWATTA